MCMAEYGKRKSEKRRYFGFKYKNMLIRNIQVSQLKFAEILLGGGWQAMMQQIAVFQHSLAS